MEIPFKLGTIEDRRTEGREDDRRVALMPRRGSSRVKTFKGAELVSPASASVKCIVRNLSETGAKLEIHSPVLHNTFDLVLDEDHLRRLCDVVWRNEPFMGVGVSK